MRTTLFATVGSVLLAIAASACCWLPIVLIAMGVSAAGLGSIVGPYRPWLLGLAGSLLAIGLYLNYRPRRVECAPGGTCRVVTRPRFQRLGRYGLWFSALLVAVSALFPRVVGGLAQDKSALQAVNADTGTFALGIDGMTCTGCELAIEAALSKVPGVIAAKASYEKKEAIVAVARGSSPSQLALATAVRSLGYEVAQTARSTTKQAPSLAGQWVGDVHLADGQTPQLVVDLDQVGSRWVGEFDVALFGIENYPVRIELAGDTVKLGFTAAQADFEGKQSADGTRLSGGLDFGDHEVEVELKRVGAPEISESFLRLEAAAEDSARVKILSPNASELRSRFNADRNQVRLVMLLSPT